MAVDLDVDQAFKKLAFRQNEMAVDLDVDQAFKKLACKAERNGR